MKQIIAMGGGGFSMEPENPLLDLYILAQAEKERLLEHDFPAQPGDER
jgi:dipeptidase E